MSGKNLWGELPSTEELRPPTQILKEQGSALSELTRGSLRGDVSVSRLHGGDFSIEFFIVAPYVDNYHYLVLVAEHSVDLYPVTVAVGWDRYGSKEKKIECSNEAAFEEAVGSILSSGRIKRVVASLLAQSHAM